MYSSMSSDSPYCIWRYLTHACLSTLPWVMIPVTIIWCNRSTWIHGFVSLSPATQLEVCLSRPFSAWNSSVKMLKNDDDDVICPSVIPKFSIPRGSFVLQFVLSEYVKIIKTKVKVNLMIPTDLNFNAPINRHPEHALLGDRSRFDVETPSWHRILRCINQGDWWILTKNKQTNKQTKNKTKIKTKQKQTNIPKQKQNNKQNNKKMNRYPIAFFCLFVFPTFTIGFFSIVYRRYFFVFCNKSKKCEKGCSG